MSDEINQQQQCQTCSVCFLTNDELREHLNGYRSQERLLSAQLEQCRAHSSSLDDEHENHDYENGHADGGAHDSTYLRRNDKPADKLCCPHEECDRDKPFPKRQKLVRHFAKHVRCKEVCVYCFEVLTLASQYIAHADTHKLADTTKNVYTRQICDRLKQNVAESLEQCQLKGVQTQKRTREELAGTEGARRGKAKLNVVDDVDQQQRTGESISDTSRLEQTGISTISAPSNHDDHPTFAITQDSIQDLEVSCTEPVSSIAAQQSSDTAPAYNTETEPNATPANVVTSSLSPKPKRCPAQPMKSTSTSPDPIHQRPCHDQDSHEYLRNNMKRKYSKGVEKIRKRTKGTAAVGQQTKGSARDLAAENSLPLVVGQSYQPWHLATSYQDDRLLSIQVSSSDRGRDSLSDVYPQGADSAQNIQYVPRTSHQRFVSPKSPPGSHCHVYQGQGTGESISNTLRLERTGISTISALLNYDNNTPATAPAVTQDSLKYSTNNLISPVSDFTGQQLVVHAVPATTSLGVIQLEKDTFQQIVLERPADILGNIWFGSMPGFAPFVSLRLSVASGGIIRPSGREVLIPSPAPDGNRILEGVYSINLEDFIELIQRDGFGGIFWNETWGKAFVSVEVMDEQLVANFIRVGKWMGSKNNDKPDTLLVFSK